MSAAKLMGRQPVAPVRGLALVAVLWVVAALTLMVASTLYGIRGEVQAAGRERLLVQGGAQADAALALLLRQWGQPGAARIQRAVRSPVAFAGVQMEVRAYPLTGFVDVNQAPVELLTEVFAVAGGQERAQAEAFAQAVVAAREAPEFKPEGRRFAVLEDLLQVQGIDYDTYQRVAGVFSVDGMSGGRVNPMAAPVEVLAVLFGGDGAAAEKFAQAREGAEIDAQGWGMNAAFLDRSVSSRYLLVVAVPLPDGETLLAHRWVDFRVDSANGLPWTVFHARDVLVLSRS